MTLEEPASNNDARCMCTDQAGDAENVQNFGALSQRPMAAVLRPLSTAAARSAAVRCRPIPNACGCLGVGRAERLGLAISLVSQVPEKVWYCRQKGYKPWLKPKERDTRTHEEGGHTIWYNEQELLKVRAASSMEHGAWPIRQFLVPGRSLSFAMPEPMKTASTPSDALGRIRLR